jgi:hypothetical protein
MSVFRLFLYNVPQDKNQNDLAGEFNYASLIFSSCTLHNQMAIVSFETQEDFYSFSSHFQQLRDNTFLYKCLV